LKKWRLERDLTQRGLGLPASTVAEWERGSRRPKGAVQIRRLAEALALPQETVYRALGQSPPLSEDDNPRDLEALFRSTREALLRAYRVGDTAAMAACQERLRALGPKIPQKVAAEFLAGHAVDPMATVDLGGMLFHADQWNAAALALEGSLKVLPMASPLRTRVESNLGMIYAALGEFELALAHDEAYLGLAREQNDGWLSVLAHGQWVEHQIPCDPLDIELLSHLEALHRWNISGIRSDPFLEIWEALARAELALARKERQEAKTLLRQIHDLMDAHSELSAERMAVSLVEAKYLASYDSPQKALDLLLDSLHRLASARPLVERLLTQQELCRVARTLELTQTREWQLTLIATYQGLGARAWVDRLCREWDLQMDDHPVLNRGPKSIS